MAPSVDQLRTRLENTRRSTAMLPPHSTATMSREELVGLLEMVLALADQMRGRGAAEA